MHSEQAVIDAVVTWVDGDDPAHRAKLEAHLASLGRRPHTAAPTRFRSVGEIDWCVASLLRFAPYLRRIHIVTDQQVPPLMARAAQWPPTWRDKLRIVDHREIFAGHEDVLPTFNCRPIETLLFRVPDLAEHFIYLNDDMLLLRPAPVQAFFVDGRPVIRGRWLQPLDRELIRRIKRAVRLWLGRPKPLQPLHQRSQSLAASLLGFDRRYFGTDHVPYTLRRSVLETYFAAHPQHLRDNIVPRLRDASQFCAKALANHCEIAAGTALLEADEARLYLEPDTMTLPALQRTLAGAQADPGILFGCIQSLDVAPPPLAQATIDWLDRVIGRDPPAEAAHPPDPA